MVSTHRLTSATPRQLLRLARIVSTREPTLEQRTLLHRIDAAIDYLVDKATEAGRESVIQECW